MLARVQVAALSWSKSAPCGRVIPTACGNDLVATARGQEEHLPHLRAHYFADDGHLILFSRILGELAAR